MKQFLLVLFHFFAESKKPKNEIARPDTRPYASAPGIIPIASARRAGIFTNPGQPRLTATSKARGEGEQA
jgi:hypothetical protein